MMAETEDESFVWWKIKYLWMKSKICRFVNLITDVRMNGCFLGKKLVSNRMISMKI